ADLAVALAIASAARRVPVKTGVAAFGEIGLTGRLRPAAQAERRLQECAKLGLSAVVAPTGTPADGKIEVEAAETLRQAIRAGLDGDRSEGDDLAQVRASLGRPRHHAYPSGGRPAPEESRAPDRDRQGRTRHGVARGRR